MALKEKTLHVLSLPVRYFKLICFWLGFATLTLLTTLLFSVFIFFNSLPTIKSHDLEGLKKVAAVQIKKHYENSKKKHHWISIKDINRDFVYTVIMAEDALFLTHRGFNYDAIINALFENVKADEIKYGASTISQQVAKNLFLSNEKSVVRKIKEYFITRDLEKKLSKNEILELYLNLAEFGPDIYGVGEAARYYFKTTPDKINAAQGAFIAIMLPSPREYHYKLFQNKNFSPSLKRKYLRILKDMRFKEYISAGQYRAYRRYNHFITEEKK